VSDKFQPLPIEPRRPFVRAAGPDHHLGLVGDRLDALFAGLERGMRPLAAEDRTEHVRDQAQAIEPRRRAAGLRLH
jgi:hypothetical protein